MTVAVSNPYREFISRARGPVSLYRANPNVSNPYREFISRAHALERKRVLVFSCFKPLSGIHLARTVLPRLKQEAPGSFKPLSGIHLARTRAGAKAGVSVFMFQTPIGNSSRAHRVAALETRSAGKFQTPIGNSSRAHDNGFAVTTKGKKEFQTPIGNSSRAHDYSIHEGPKQCFVSNPYREFISRAPVAWIWICALTASFQTPIGNSSRAHFSLGRPVRQSPAGFKPLSGIHLART